MTYGRIHRTFFDSSICETDVTTRLVFIAMIVLSDRHGRLDVTRQALARRINVPIEDVDRAIKTLSSPDPSSRTPDHDGRRIVALDPERSWGWQVVNKEQYRSGDTVDIEEVREQNRDRKRLQRSRERSSSPSSSSRTTNLENTYTPGVTVTAGHAASQAGHVESRPKRDAEAFERLWKLVPRREGKNDARKHFNAFLTGSCKADPQKTYREDLDRLTRDLEAAIRNYVRQVEGKDPQYVKHGSTLFYNFQDYIEAPAIQPRASAQRPEGLQGVEV